METRIFETNDQILLKARDFVIAEAKQANVSEELIGHIDLIIEELVSNIVNHAYAKAPGKIELACGVEQSRFSLIIRDNGLEFNPLTSPEPDVSLEIDDRPIGGLGIYLVKQLSSSQSYQRDKNQNVLKISFDL